MNKSAFGLILLIVIFYQAQAAHYCKPSDGWMYAKCSDCVPCGNETCASGLCAELVNCENWNTVCGQSPNPNKTNNCSAYQHWDNTTQQCVNSFGWCWNVNNYNLSMPGFDKCSKCKPCLSSNGENCAIGETCVQATMCENYNNCAANATPNMTDSCPDGYYWDNSQQSCEVAFGYCNNIFANQCFNCKPCASEGGCGNQSMYGQFSCGWALCENFKYCTVNLALNETKANNHNCSDNMYWDEQAQHCLSGKGWCNPPSGIYNSCSECIAVNTADYYNFSCPNGWPVQDFVYCEIQGTYCGGFPKCNPNQYFNNATFACQNLQGWCKPTNNSWLYDQCSQCTECPATGTCPGNTECVSDVNCQDFKTLCSQQKAFTS